MSRKFPARCALILLAGCLIAIWPSGGHAKDAKSGTNSIVRLLSTASIKISARVCMACHTFTKGGTSKMGPNLYGIVGSKIAGKPGYNFSPAMEEMNGKTWSFERLDKFLENPEAVIPGSKMPFAGIRNERERANIIAWLRTLSDHPAPLSK